MRECWATASWSARCREVLRYFPMTQLADGAAGRPDSTLVWLVPDRLLERFVAVWFVDLTRETGWVHCLSAVTRHSCVNCLLSFALHLQFYLTRVLVAALLMSVVCVVIQLWITLGLLVSLSTWSKYRDASESHPQHLIRQHFLQSRIGRKRAPFIF